MAPIARASRSKKAKVVEEVDREQNDIAPLTGNLVKLPYETLVEILSLCTPTTFARMIRTCKFVKELAEAEEKTLYRKLYNNTHPFRSPHIAHAIYSPTKQTVATVYPTTHKLPVSVVYSWKDQYRMMAMFYARQLQLRRLVCMKCGEESPSGLESCDVFSLRLCPFDFAANLVLVSNLSAHQVTAKDVVGLPTVELKTEGMLGNFRMAKFYSAIQLKSIALQKHGSNYTGPQIQDLDVVDKKAFKDDLVMTATLLHGGISYSTNVVRVAQPLGLSKPAMDLQYEFPNAATGKSFKKDLGLKKRDFSLVMADFVKIVKKHIAANPGDTFFLPAPQPGPLVPTEDTVLAFGKIRELLSHDFLSKYSFYDPRSPFKMSSLQNYVLNPTDSNWQVVKQIIREEEMEKLNAGLRATIDTNWENMQPVITKLETAIGSQLKGYQISRVSLLAQIECIIGESKFDVHSCVQILPGRSIVNPGKHQIVFNWGSEYFGEGNLIPVLQKVYRVSQSERGRSLSSFACQFLSKEAYGSHMTANLTIQLLPSYANGNAQRVEYKLSERSVVPRETYEEEISEAVKLIRSGVISSSTVIATLHHQGQCVCYGRTHKKCVGECWIKIIPFEKEMEMDSEGWSDCY